MLGDSGIENILRRLDRLTQDEARMMEAHVLEVIHGLMNNMKVVMDGTSGPQSISNIAKIVVLLGGEASIDAIRNTLSMLKYCLN